MNYAIDRSIFSYLHDLRRLGLILLTLIAVPTNIQAQEAKYGIDHPIDECKAYFRPGVHVAIAFSTTQTSHCVYGSRGGLAAVRAEAITICTRNVPANLRKKAPCKIIMEDGRIVQGGFVKSLRKPQRAPVSLEIFEPLRQGLPNKRSGNGGPCNLEFDCDNTGAMLRS